MGLIDDKAVLAAKNEQILEELLNEQKGFLISCTYRSIHRYITQSDDEWSIAQIAFVSAVKTYDLTKGSFLPYAELRIKHALIDYYRSTQKYHPELSVDPSTFQTNPEEDRDASSIALEVAEKISHHIDTSLQY